MKKIFYLFIAASIPVALSAKEIAPAQASDIASGFMQTLSPAVSGKSLVKAPSRHATAQENAAAPYYIFNSADGGYVIVAVSEPSSATAPTDPSTPTMLPMDSPEC